MVANKSNKLFLFFCRKAFYLKQFVFKLELFLQIKFTNRHGSNKS